MINSKLSDKILTDEQISDLLRTLKMTLINITIKGKNPLLPKNNAAKSLIELMYKQGYISSSRETILGMKIYSKK